MDEYALSAAELLQLMLIATEMRTLAKGLSTGRTTVAGVIAARAGVKTSASMRALLGLPDLRRPRPETFDSIARGIGVPERAEAWKTAWAAVPHPKGAR